MSCSICFDQFRNPKLLPCRHTFCRKCLENHAKCKTVNGPSNKLKCPICRQIVCIPSGGINGLFSNYFVRDRRYSLNNVCEDCNTSVMNTCCDLCDDSLCLDCGRNHRCQFKCTTTELVSSDSESDDETDLPIEIRILSRNFNPSKIQANVVSMFSVCNDSSATARASSILPLHQGGALVVIDEGPYIFRFDEHFKQTETIKVGTGIRGIAYGQNERIFLLQGSPSQILELCGKKVQTFTTLPCIRPLAMSIFPDGRSVVIADDSMIIILQRTGSVYDVQRNRDVRPSGVAVIPNLNCICISDSTHGHVVFILCDGKILGMYKEGLLRNRLSMMSISDNLRFVPQGLCCDGNENVVVYDGGSGSLHLIDSSGQLIGLINTKSPLGLGSPGEIRMAPDGDFWIGDSQSSTIRILKVIRYKNLFRLLE